MLRVWGIATTESRINILLDPGHRLRWYKRMLPAKIDHYTRIDNIILQMTQSGLIINPDPIFSKR